VIHSLQPTSVESEDSRRHPLNTFTHLLPTLTCSCSHTLLVCHTVFYCNWISYITEYGLGPKRSVGQKA
jgi:hypothetical protein